MWNGVFSPILRKSIGNVKFVPVVDMTSRDWAWLDYDNIRTTAQNRMARVIMQGRLLGFFQVMIAQKAAKNEYFWPATAEDVRQFAESESPDFFINTAEADDVTRAVENLDVLRRGIFLLPTAVVFAILQAIRAHLVSDDEKEAQLVRVTQESLDALEREAVEMLTASIMMWEMSLEEAEHLLDDMPESDEVDDVRDWINDEVSRIAQARQQLVAGRGINQGLDTPERMM